MRIATLYDIHGNAPALQAVLQDIASQNVDIIVVGGDVVSGPMPRETLQLLLCSKTPICFLCGNADREVISQMRGEDMGGVPDDIREECVWVAQQLDAQYQDLLSRWEKTLHIEINDTYTILFCHATPQSDTEIFTCVTPEIKLLPIFSGLAYSLVVCGHTHMQFDRMVGNIRVVNSGSVGMPYGEIGAYWLLIDETIQFMKT
jgi:predicted phosphodiesterase